MKKVKAKVKVKKEKKVAHEFPRINTITLQYFQVFN